MYIFQYLDTGAIQESEILVLAEFSQLLHSLDDELELTALTAGLPLGNASGHSVVIVGECGVVQVLT